ncbi:MAG: DUF3800 domain-containing protein [Chloroflexota bacterium]|nr:DUF3800 domain-containing protein [Chloroflexota bacterium]
MNQTFNVYCDESCHLENDGQQAMVLGAVWCPLEKSREIAVRLREIKVKHHLSPTFEIKWVKVSPAKVQFYLDVMDYFFDDDDLHFRALIVPDKTILRHQDFKQTHDDWYYKMYFDMLKVILHPDARYRIYLDYKDTRGAAKVARLHDVLCNNMYDFSRQIIERVQLVRSEEIESLQLADLLIGTVAYVNRGLASSTAKQRLVNRMRERSRYTLTRTTLLRANKVNLFRWHPTEARE